MKKENSPIQCVIQVLKQRFLDAESKNIPFNVKTFRRIAVSSETKELIRNFFKKNENNDFSKMDDKEIVEKLKKLGFSIKNLYHCTSIFIGYLCYYPLQNDSLSTIPQQIRNGVTEFAHLVNDDETKPFRGIYLAYYPFYMDFVNYVFTLQKQLRKGKLIAPENYQGTAFDAYFNKLNQLEESFHEALTKFKEGLNAKDVSQYEDKTLFLTPAYYARATHRRLIEIGIT